MRTGQQTAESTRAEGEERLLQRYFAEIRHIPVLSAAAERDLARRLREAEDELRERLEALPQTAEAFVLRWREIRSDGRVTGLLSRTHEPPLRDRSPDIDRAARRLERLLAERDTIVCRTGGAALAALDLRIARALRAADLRPELLHEVLGELLVRGVEPGQRETLGAAEAAEQRARSAKDTFVRHNLRLVVHQAKGFRNYGLSFLDLIQEGALGLIRAVEKFDERLGNRFSTYAIWWIQQSCMRAVQQGARTVRLPAPVQDEIRRYRRAVERLASRGPAAPAASEIARVLGLAPAEVDGLARLDRGPLRLDEPVPGRERGTLADQLVDGGTPSDAAVDREQLEQRIAGLLETLPPRERLILRARYGFGDGDAQTLQRVAVRLGLSRERVRQLEQRALARLTAAARAAGLEAWLPERELSA
jgi:RNA polymerase sigma factor (sigma-70 family)